MTWTSQNLASDRKLRDPVGVIDTARGDTAKKAKHQCQGLRRSIHHDFANGTHSQGSAERMGGCRRRLVSPGFFSGTSVYSPSAGFNILPQIVAYSTHSNPTPLNLLFARGALTQLDSVMRVIAVWYACHWCLSCISLMISMLVLDVCQD